MATIAEKIATYEKLLDMPDIPEEDKAQARENIAKLKEEQKAESEKPAAETGAAEKKTRSVKRAGGEHKPRKHKKAKKEKPAKKKHGKKAKHGKPAAKPAKHKKHAKPKHKPAAKPAKRKKRKAVHKKMTPKRKKMLEKYAEKKAKKHHAAPAKVAKVIKKIEHKELSLAEQVKKRIESIKSEADSLPGLIDKLEGAAKAEAREALHAHLMKFEHGGEVKGGMSFINKLITGRLGSEFKKGGPVEGTRAAAEKSHAGVSIDRGFRLPHGYKTTAVKRNSEMNLHAKGATHVHVASNRVLKGGHQAVKGAKKQFYSEGGSAKPKRKLSIPENKRYKMYGQFGSEAKAKAQQAKYPGSQIKKTKKGRFMVFTPPKG